MPQIWLIVGASKGIGLEFVSQLLARGDYVIATGRAPSSMPSPLDENGSMLWSLTGSFNGANLTILECDVDDEGSIQAFRDEVWKLGRAGRVLEKGVINFVIFNASIPAVPNRISEITFSTFSYFLKNITIGPLIAAQELLTLSSPLKLKTPVSSLGSVGALIHIRTLVFISSETGSTTNFQASVDRLGAYATSKAALNHGLRLLAAELYRKASADGTKSPCILAIHPGGMRVEMACDSNQGWESEGKATPREVAKSMLRIIKEKGCGGMDEGGWMTAEKEGSRVESGEATFWTWDGKRYPW